MRFKVSVILEHYIRRKLTIFSENSLGLYLNNQPDALIIQIYSVIKLYMFRASSLPIIRSSVLTFGTGKVSCRFLLTVSKQSLVPVSS
jgi:hypothetical protein